MHARDRPRGVRVDAPCRHDEDSPLAFVQLLAPIEVALPVRLALDVATVVLHDEAQRRIAQVQASDHPPVLVPDLEVDDRLWQPGEHDQHSQPALHRRVDLVAHVSRRDGRRAGVMITARPAVLHQSLGRYVEEPDECVTDDDQVEQREHRGELDEHLEGMRDPDASQHSDPSRTAPHVVANPGAVPALPRMVDGHVDLRVGRNRQPPQRRRRRVAQKGVGRVDDKGCFRPDLHGVRDVAADVHLFEDAPEERAPQHAAIDPGAQGILSRERTAAVEGQFRAGFDHAVSLPRDAPRRERLSTGPRRTCGRLPFPFNCSRRTPPAADRTS